MWILPTNLPVNSPISASALVTEESISDFTESLDKNYEPSLLVRSKLSRWKTFLQKWKQGCYLRLRCGLIYARSLGLTSKGLTYSAGGFHVSPSRQRESETPIAILDTSSQQSLKESDTQSLELFSWKTSKESYLPNSQETIGATQQELQFCSMSSENWSEWVTKQRQEYSQRVKSVRLTRGSGSLSWPTANARDWKDSINGTHPPSRPNLSEQTLGQAVSVAHGQAAPANPSTLGMQDAWQTPTTNMDMVRSEEGIQKRKEFRASIGRKSIPDGNLGEQMQRVIKHGPPAPENPSTNGSRQGLWATPRTPTGGPESAQRKQELGRTTSGGGCLKSQVLDSWPTVRSCEWKGGNMTTQAAVDREAAHFNLVGVVAKESGMNAKLNPRWVETLMGIPIGWVMPSCASPVTIAPTNFDCSETESFQPQQSELL